MSENRADDEKIKGFVSYLGFWVTGIFFLVTEKKNAYIRFHAMQSTLVFAAIHLVILILKKIFPFFGIWMIDFVFSYIIEISTFFLWLFLMFKAYSGEKYKLPYIGEAAEKQLQKFDQKL